MSMLVYLVILILVTWAFTFIAYKVVKATPPVSIFVLIAVLDVAFFILGLVPGNI